MFHFNIQSIKMKLFPRRFFRQYLPLLLLYGDTFWFQVPSETLLYQIIRMEPSKVYDYVITFYLKNQITYDKL